MKNSNSRQVFIQTVFVIPIPCFPIIVLNVCATFTLSIYLLSNSPILNRCTRLCWLEIHKKSNGMCRKCTAQATWLIHTPNKQARFEKKYSKWCDFFVAILFSHSIEIRHLKGVIFDHPILTYYFNSSLFFVQNQKYQVMLLAVSFPKICKIIAPK